VDNHYSHDAQAVILMALFKVIIILALL